MGVENSIRVNGLHSENEAIQITSLADVVANVIVKRGTDAQSRNAPITLKPSKEYQVTIMYNKDSKLIVETFTPGGKGTQHSRTLRLKDNRTMEGVVQLSTEQEMAVARNIYAADVITPIIRS